MERMTSWTNLSLIVGIPKGLVFPGFPGFGIMTCLTPIQIYSLCSTASLTSNILFLVSASMFSESGPGVSDPLFCFSFR